MLKWQRCFRKLLSQANTLVPVSSNDSLEGVPLVGSMVHVFVDPISRSRCFSPTSATDHKRLKCFVLGKTLMDSSTRGSLFWLDPLRVYQDGRNHYRVIHWFGKSPWIQSLGVRAAMRAMEECSGWLLWWLPKMPNVDNADHMCLFALE